MRPISLLMPLGKIWTFPCRHKLEGHGGWVSDVAISPTNDSAITVAGDDLAVVWDLLTGSCKNVLEGHSGEVLSVVMTRQGRLVTLARPNRTPPPPVNG